MNVKLVVVQGKPQGKEIPLRTPKFLVGRGPECHLRPNSELVSRHHSLFTLEDGVVRLRDLGSTNGTMVNGQRIDGEVVIQSGDLVQVGPLGFKLMMDSVPAAAAPTQPDVAVAQPGRPVPAQTAPVSKLGSKDANENDIEQWLIGDSKHQIPTSGAEVYTGETQMELKTTIDEGAGRDTQTDLALGPAPLDPPQESEEKIVEAEGGAKIKIRGAKQKIDKTLEDTSRAAADIIRRLMDRRPGK